MGNSNVHLKLPVMNLKHGVCVFSSCVYRVGGQLVLTKVGILPNGLDEGR